MVLNSSDSIATFVGTFFPSTVDSLLMDTSVKWTPSVGPCLSLLPLFGSTCI